MILIEAAIDVPTENWHGCYDASWKGFINNESFSHPANTLHIQQHSIY